MTKGADGRRGSRVRRSAAYAPPGEHNARTLIAIDADRSQIRSALREEFVDLELGDVLGKTLSPRYLEWMRRIAICMEIFLAPEGAAQCQVFCRERHGHSAAFCAA